MGFSVGVAAGKALDFTMSAIERGTPAPAAVVRLFAEQNDHLRALTGLRGWAALWVCLYHAWTFAKYPPIELPFAGQAIDLTPLISIGFAGVSIFFVLSGFLLALPYAEWQAGLRERPATGRYLLRRVARVFPAYYAQLALLVLLAAWLPWHASIDDWSALWRHLLMLFVPPPLGTTPINMVWWTLPIEFSFYLALPFLAFLLPMRRWWLLLIGSLFAMTLWRYGVVTLLADRPMQERVYASYQLPGSLDTFGLGMLTAMLHVNRDRLPRWLWTRERADWLGALGLLLILVAIYWLAGARSEYWRDNPIFYCWTPALGLGTAALVFSAMNGGRVVEFLFGNRTIVFLGTISYSLYLWHHPLLEWLNSTSLIHGQGKTRLLMLVAIGVPLTLVVSALSYVLIERPFLRFRSPRYLSAQKTMPPNPT